MKIYVVINARNGNLVVGFNFPKNLGAWRLSLSEYNMRLVVYKPEFAADNNEVKITALMTDAAKAIPIRSKTIVNGLCATDSCSFNSNESV